MSRDPLPPVFLGEVRAKGFPLFVSDRKPFRTLRPVLHCCFPARLSPMRRREFLALCGASAVSPSAALSQEVRAVHQVGVLMDFTEADTEGQRRIAAFRSGLKSRTSVAVRWSAGDPIQAPMR